LASELTCVRISSILCNNTIDASDVDDPDLYAIANLVQVPISGEVSLGDKAKFVHDALQWIRNNDPHVS
jgi:hypothetical protein